jgi:hypothetical protein
MVEVLWSAGEEKVLMKLQARVEDADEAASH